MATESVTFWYTRAGLARDGKEMNEVIRVMRAVHAARWVGVMTWRAYLEVLEFHLTHPMS